MILPWAHRLISAGAHGLRRIPGQSVNLAHLIWRTPRAPAPLPSGNKAHPRWFSTRGYKCWGASTKALSSRTASADPGPHAAKSTGVPALRYRFGGDGHAQRLDSYPTTFCSIAPKMEWPLESSAQMRTTWPCLRKGVLAAPWRMVSTTRTSAKQE
jgi:hypothetical protein